MNDMELVQAEEAAKNKSLPIATEAKAIVVKDAESLAYANEAFLLIDAARKEIKDYFNPIVEAWKESKRKADEGRALTISKWEKAEKPLVEARAYLDTQIIAYKKEQDRIRAEEQERLRQESIKAEMERRKQEEEEKLRQAAELEAAGAVDEAEALMVEAIEDKEKPVEVFIPPPVTPTVKLEGMTTETKWHAEVDDLRALCLAIGQGKQPTHLVTPNLTALNQLAVGQRNTLHIPGVRAVSETRTKTTGRVKAA